MSHLEVVKKYVDTSHVTDQEIMALQDHYEGDSRQMYRDVISTLLENYVFECQHFQDGRPLWRKDEYVEKLIREKTNFRNWFLNFLDYPYKEGETKIVNFLRIGTDEENRKTFNGFTILDTLGSGSFGKVRQCIHNNTREKFAVKIMKKGNLKKVKNKDGSSAYDDVQNEIAILKNLRHKFVVKLYVVIEAESDDSDIYLIMELAKGVVFDYRKEMTMDEDLAKRYFKEVLSAIDYLHTSKVVHLDLKPDNIFIGLDDHIRLGDFGCSKKFKLDSLRTVRGTPAFTSPEACIGKEYKGTLLDLWSCGVCLYSFVFGFLPFKGDTFMETFDNIKKSTLDFSSRSDLSQHVLHLISSLLEKDPKKRITLEEVKKHPWFKEKKKYKKFERTRRKSIRLSRRLSIGIEKVNNRWSISFLKDGPATPSETPTPPSPRNDPDTSEGHRRNKITRLTGLKK